MQGERVVRGAVVLVVVGGLFALLYWGIGSGGRDTSPSVRASGEAPSLPRDKSSPKEPDQPTSVQQMEAEHRVEIKSGSKVVPKDTHDEAQVAVKPDETEGWKAEYSGRSAGDLKAAATKLKQDISIEESNEADRREEAGLYEVVPAVSKEDRPGESVVYSLSPNKELRRVALPPSEYPELYALKRKLAWVEREAGLRAKD